MVEVLGTRFVAADHWYLICREVCARFDAALLPLDVRHVKARTATETLAEKLNDRCDTLAKAAHAQPVAVLEDPVHLLPRYVLTLGRNGYLEGDPQLHLLAEAAT